MAYPQKYLDLVQKICVKGGRKSLQMGNLLWGVTNLCLKLKSPREREGKSLAAKETRCRRYNQMYSYRKL